MNVLIKREYDYAIRICAYLAGNYQGGQIAVSQIADRLFITKPFATKIIHQLKKNGIVATVQGKDGGIYLDREPTELSVYDVLEAMGFNSTLNECIKNPKLCPLMVTCDIHNFFIQQENNLIKNFKKKKIAEFAFTDARLKSINP